VIPDLKSNNLEAQAPAAHHEKQYYICPGKQIAVSFLVRGKAVTYRRVRHVCSGDSIVDSWFILFEPSAGTCATVSPRSIEDIQSDLREHSSYQMWLVLDDTASF